MKRKGAEDFMSKKQIIVFIVAVFFVGVILGGITRFTGIDIPIAAMAGVGIIIGAGASVGTGAYDKKKKDGDKPK